MGSESWFRKQQAARQQHRERMHRAAGISSVQLVCHKDTWKTLDSFWGVFDNHPAQVPKERVKGHGDGRVEVTLSGPSLVTLLKLARRPTFGPDRRALARRAYQQLAKVVDAIDPEAQPGQPIPPIVLDDKLGRTTAS
ncbi:hypothetical protein AB0M12_41845 [Nocardia vinacea]|uniref:hypothetical protein n=1 Tax=Nocardia vinacea TaxID=96468 RepID=UPI00342FA4EC